MSLPKSIKIYEVGPREGFQIEDGPISTGDKVELINKLNHTGISSIEVTSFVSPKWVPKMADAEKVLHLMEKKPNVEYRTVYLNINGLRRALNNNVTIDGVLLLTASNTFSKRNTNKSIQKTLYDLKDWITVYKESGLKVDQLALMAAFGCNFEGNITLPQTVNIIQNAMSIAEENNEKIRKIKLADTMGWANPQQIKRTINIVKENWPEIEIILHLHDTRGLGLANAYAAMEEGVREFETAIGGLGGCPFAAVKGAAGNIATEDLVFMCEEMGIDTSIDLEGLLECTKFAEEIVGHRLPAHLTTGGMFSDVRQSKWINQEKIYYNKIRWENNDGF
ncbi:hydroxymethylglutaryl-CoA lyase [Oceanobacillus saliphilus]|uniref:hydroxymethylglutaryl-CoA lyase n=1 Tax=Oceanobacillus saliphilus TaxID=2925834 RepID=UPI00201E4CBF|nr:hydroxymethylglutaryl-CoA lyase [Oceanobacillus saliphilus]